ncbi:MAG: hypothetical protein R2824_28220 [Saprospiraceae bacterium]|nr:hypothetical protein [Lewinella sp.]
MTVTIKPYLKKPFIFILLLSIGSLSLTSCSRKMVNIEASNRCKCIKRVDNEIERKARKSEEEGRRSSWSNPTYAKNVLKAGSEDCAALRRKSEHRGFVARMTREERSEYDAKVLEIMQRKCPKRLAKVQD